MYRTKKDVDKHVESLILKLSVKEFKTRAYSVARLYFEVGDYASCQRYVEQYLTQKDNNAAAHKLLGQALQKLGEKEKALEHYKTSLDIDPTQTSVILDICEILADDEVTIDPGRAKYWCEKAEAIFPRHPVTFRLRERLITIANPDPQALVNLLKAELGVRPKDAVLHARLIKHYLLINQVKDAFDHSCKVEFGGNTFLNNYAWYETLTEILNNNSCNSNDWLYQLLLLTVRERICVLSLTELPNGSSKSLIESNELLHSYDQAIECVAKLGAPPGFGEFHNSLLQHHRGQFAFHAATFLLKKAKKDQLSWRDATKLAAPLMLIAWQTVPLDSKVNWLIHAPEKQQNAVHRWYIEGTYRCSQSGHYLLSNIQDKTQSFLDRISQGCSGPHWRDKIYEKLFTSRDHLAKIKSSHFSNAFNSPVLRLPRKIEVEAYDMDSQKEYANSLHHFVWILLNYKNYAHFKCTLFDMLTPTATTCGPETLNKLDVHAFLYCAALTTRKLKSNEIPYVGSEKPNVLPANITDLLCSLSQMKWWDCAYKFSQNELGAELTDIRATLSRGIEVVRCVDNHGLDPELLCILGKIFSDKAKLVTVIEERINLENRACLYYSFAIPLLEKLKSKISFKLPVKRMFDYTHKELTTKEVNLLLEESKLYVAICHLNDCEYEKVIQLLLNLKSPQAYFYLSQTYKKIALDGKNLSRDISVETNSKHALLTKAKSFAYKALEKLKDTELSKNHPLYCDTQQLIEEIETNVNKLDPDISNNITNDVDSKYSSDENISIGNEHVLPRNNHHALRNLSSTPKHQVTNLTNYRTAVDSQMLESTRVDQQLLERIENQIKNFQNNFTDHFMAQTKAWFEENQKLGNQIMSTIQSDIQNTNDQFKLLKISVDQVKDQIDECKNECKDVGDLKKQIADLKKEVVKLKKATSEQTIDESDLYNLDEDYRTNDGTASFAAQLPFQPPQVIPQFNQRLVSPFPVPQNPYQLYSQSLYNLYNQYSQFGQTSAIPNASPLFDPTRASVNYPSVYPTPDQMYLDVAHLVPPTVPAPPPIPTVPSTLHSVPTASIPSSVTAPKPASTVETKGPSRALPVNVVITSSDPLPTCTTTATPILSVTIPPKHIKGTPHNYQIPMPSANDTNVISPPVFSFPASGNNTGAVTTASPLTWPELTAFRTAQTTTSTSDAVVNEKLNESLDHPKSVGGTSDMSPNTSVNKSRTLSERSNTSVENYDPCPDFKPVIPLPAEIKITTGEEDETTIFSARAKLFRFVDKQWKERGIGEMKLLKHKDTGKVRVLMRREQIHKICANHIITFEMEIKPMKNETKAYFWVANDFADEAVVLEKFCIRFKTADIAKQFYEVFEAARLETKSIAAIIPKKEHNVMMVTTKPELVTPIKPPKDVASQQKKTEFGGFTFTSAPAFKNVSDNDKMESKPIEPMTNKVNVFSSLTFKTMNNSPFSDIFTPKNQDNSIQNRETSSEINNSDMLEEFESTAEFKPVVPLPALIDQKTGEEDEIVLFQHRAKLLRFDASSKEWKERGLGDIKLLVHKDNIQKLRLLMRREQIMKVCCNHAVTKEMVFEKMPNVDKAVSWGCKDFSDGELTDATFCLRFKTAKACDGFMEAIKIAQDKMKDETKAAKEEQNAAKQGNPIGFGDKFKPKPGSWQCDTCYTNNLDNFCKCACCEQPRPQITECKISSSAVASGWGDKFKPKLGTWECNVCLIRNQIEVDSCTACSNPKDPNSIKKEINQKDSTPKFTFGIPTEKNIFEKAVATPTPLSGFGDKFKPKEGTWECSQCLIRNESNVEKCSACATSKNPKTTNDNTSFVTVTAGPKFNFGIPTATSDLDKSPVGTMLRFGDNFRPKEETWECSQCLNRNQNNIEKCSACNNPKHPSSNKTNTFITVTPGPKFNFGIPSTTTGDQKSKTEATSIFAGTGELKFNFGMPSNATDKIPNIISFGDKKMPIFETPKISAANEESANLFSQQSDEQNKLETPLKLPLLPTPQADTTTFGTKDGGTFDFVFKPKSPQKGKSPVKSPRSQKGDESDGDEYVSEDEGHHIHFNPVVPMPDKVDVVTGEENEDELYGHRAKLYRFISGEWKERGIGIVKILKHKHTGKLRVVMRREQVLKICLNHALIPAIIYTPKDEKTWLFAANDFSEGELSLQQFCLRFQNKEIALEFKDAIDKAREGKLFVKKDTGSDKKGGDNDDVVFIKEIQATAEEKQKAKELMLPENFFMYLKKEPCKGCRGCKDDDEGGKPETSMNKTISALKSSSFVPTPTVSTPLKTSSPVFQSPTNSVYGTPANFDRTVDTSIFRTPLGSIAPNTNSASLSSFNNSMSSNDSTNKENTFIQKNNESQSCNFAQSKSTNLFSSSDAQTTTKSNIILSAPKLNTLNVSSGEQQKNESNSVFGTKVTFGESKTTSIFGNTSSGVSTNKSIFGKSTDSIKGDGQKSEVQSIFGGEGYNSVNLFSSAAQGSIFGPGALTNQQKPNNGIFGSTALFGSSTVQSQAHDNGTALFKNAANQAPVLEFGKGKEEKCDSTVNTSNEQKIGELKPSDNTDKKEIPFKVDNSLSFAALSTGETGFNIQKKPDFQWEGAGQQLFTAAQKSGSTDKSKNDSRTSDDGDKQGADEDYDPHYEPIVPMPEKIVVTTGEEDEEKKFGERCKLYRYDDKTREWKERGVGEMKILYHPSRMTYRLLLRREQVHKAVLNMLLFADLELFPMKNSDRAWTWAGRNFAENPSGLQETLAVRFKSVELSNAFRDKVVECVRKLQAAAAQAIKQENDSKKVEEVISVAPLRLPKHLEDSARADAPTTVQSSVQSKPPANQNPSHLSQPSQNSEHNKSAPEVLKQVHFQEPEEVEDHEDDEDDDYDYDNNEDYDAYYNEDEDESATYYACDGEAVVQQGAMHATCEHAQIRVLFDQETYSPKILVTDSDTGEILADMLIHTDTEFQMSGDSCTWSGMDYTSNDPVDKTVTINFFDSETAMQFYDSCETSKAASYTSTDPES